MIVCFSFHSELDLQVITIEASQKPAEFLLSVVPDDKCIINIAEPTFRLQWGQMKWHIAQTSPCKR